MTQVSIAPTRTGADTAARFTLSATAREGARTPIAAFHEWWDERRRGSEFEVTRVPFADLDGWMIQPDTGNVVHRSGRFFAVEGVQITEEDDRVWSQPILNQPEIGVLGILTKEFHGVLHCLMQAKMEPGNVNALQLSPTVQATRSNYMRVHHGAQTRYLDYFRGPLRGDVLVDVAQSEQGSCFWHKQNRNIVVEVAGDVPEHEDFHWLTVDQLRSLLRIDNLVNMDARTVLACLPLARPVGHPAGTADEFTQALLRSYEPYDGAGAPTARHSSQEVRSWFTEMKARCDWRTRLVPLHRVNDWACTGDEIADHRGERLSVVAVRVRAPNREVPQWSQPLMAQRALGLAVFLARAIDGVLHLLVQARPEPGLRGIVELAPTLQLASVGSVAASREAGEPYLDYVSTVDYERLRFDTVLSEEGGRFYHSQTRYQVIDVGTDFPMDTPDNFRWLTVHQLMRLLRHSGYLNIEARTLLACVHTLW